MNANLGWGLNARNNKRKNVLTGFSGGDESSDDDALLGDPIKAANNARTAVNRDIVAEQAALRQRAETAMMMAASSANSNVYDYDAEYESFSSGTKKQKQDEADAAASVASKKDAKPRYITNLLKTAQRRNQEQEIIHERKIAKEQQELDDNLQYEGKERFITSSYRQKLAERERWAKEEEERTKREEEEEQKNAAKNKMGVGNFMFGAIGRNLLMKSGDGSRKHDGQVAEKERRLDDGDSGVDHDHARKECDHRGNESTRKNDPSWNASNKIIRYPQDDEDSSAIRNRRSQAFISADGRKDENTTHDVNATDPDSSHAGGGGVRSRQQILEERAMKIRAARERYFKRKEGGLVTQ